MEKTKQEYDQADERERELMYRTKRVTRRKFNPEEKLRILRYDHRDGKAYLQWRAN